MSSTDATPATAGHDASDDPDQDTTAEEIVFGQAIEWDEHLGDGGMKWISPLGPTDSGITPAAARQLIEGGHMAPEADHNHSPTMETLVGFAETVADMAPEVDVELRGYMISPYRPDERIRLRSIHIDAGDREELPSAVKDLFVARFGGQCLGEPYRSPDNYEANSDHYTCYWD